MDTPDSENVETSDGAPSCDGCNACGHSHDMPTKDAGGLTGWPLAIAAFFVFVLPVGLAILGAAVFGKNPDGQVVGALVGFVVGVLAAAVVARILRRRATNQKDHKEG